MPLWALITDNFHCIYWKTNLTIQPCYETIHGRTTNKAGVQSLHILGKRTNHYLADLISDMFGEGHIWVQFGVDGVCVPETGQSLSLHQVCGADEWHIPQAPAWK